MVQFKVSNLPDLKSLERIIHGRPPTAHAGGPLIAGEVRRNGFPSVFPTVYLYPATTGPPGSSGGSRAGEILHQKKVALQ